MWLLRRTRILVWRRRPPVHSGCQVFIPVFRTQLRSRHTYTLHMPKKGRRSWKTKQRKVHFHTTNRGCQSWQKDAKKLHGKIKNITKLPVGWTLVHFANEAQKTHFVERQRIMTKKDTYRVNTGSHRQHGKNRRNDIVQNCSLHIYWLNASSIVNEG